MKTGFGRLQRVYAAVLSLLLLSALSARARGNTGEKTTYVPATVIAHLPLPLPTGNQMLLQKENSKQYLYVQQAAKQGFMIVDVTKPEKPTLLKRTAESNQATQGNLQIVSPDVAIAVAPEKTPATVTRHNHPPQTVARPTI